MVAPSRKKKYQEIRYNRQKKVFILVVAFFIATLPFATKYLIVDTYSYFTSQTEISGEIVNKTQFGKKCPKQSQENANGVEKKKGQPDQGCGTVIPEEQHKAGKKLNDVKEIEKESSNKDIDSETDLKETPENTDGIRKNKVNNQDEIIQGEGTNKSKASSEEEIIDEKETTISTAEKIETESKPKVSNKESIEDKSELKAIDEEVESKSRSITNNKEGIEVKSTTENSKEEVKNVESKAIKSKEEKLEVESKPTKSNVEELVKE